MSSLLSFNHISKNKYDEILIIAHGLFGSKTNWMSTAKFLSENLPLEIVVVDLRNHGSSFWSDYHDYFTLLPSNYNSKNDNNFNVSVFYIHPTTLYSSNYWNADTSHFRENYAINLCLENQASVFAGRI